MNSNPNMFTYHESLNRQTNEILISIESLLKDLIASQGVMTDKLDSYLNLMVSSSLETSPNITQGVVVGITPMLLRENAASPSLTVNIANLDPAQPLWIGLESVNTNNGRIIQPRNNATIVVPIGKAIYGVTDVGTINAVVSDLHSLYSVLLQARPGGA